FTADDATDWERRLGLITNSLTPLADRKLAIKNKLNQPGQNPAKQNYRYLQEQLDNAGFSVTVFENRFNDYPGEDYFTKDPIQINGDTSVLTPIQHGDIQHGDTQTGSVFNIKIVNHISEARDLYFDFVQNFRNTFYVGGDPLGTYANVPLSRHDEFRQLILRTKPVQTVGLLFINYI
ncbi:MAG TPA: hypothetical protein VI522_07460, partial [Gammaproteobacteria bacterium]|nr:hypothetical protein [Gammaproteobacteria bacterium]